MVCIFQGQSSQQIEKCYIIPGREIPKWFEKVNICDIIVGGPHSKIKIVKIQLPVSVSGFDEWRGIVLCVVFLPSERYRSHGHHYINVTGKFPAERGRTNISLQLTSGYGKVESHHLWLRSVSKNEFCFRETPGRSIDKNGFHQVVLEITTSSVEVEKIGFRVV